MKLVFLDFESYWSAEYSLSKLTPAAYVMDPRWELQSLSICMGRKGAALTAIGLAEIQALVATIDFSDAMVVAHNNEGFDAYVAAWRLGIRPKMWGCTMAMARPIFGRTVGLGLGKLVKHFNIGVKDNTVLIQTKGRYLRDFTEQEIRDMRTYNSDDTLQCREVFYRILPYYDSEELFQIDLLIRMRVEPAFVADLPLLREAAAAERVRKHKALLQLAELIGVEGQGEDTTWGAVNDEVAQDLLDEEVAEEVRSELASTTRFAKLLESLGVEVPMKKSNRCAWT